MERLQKIISAAGVASRRKAEELITAGLVQVNGQTVTELGAKADAGKDHIRVNGKLIKFSGHHVYILLNKPKGYVTTLSDPEGRPTILDLLQGVKQRVYPVGRLDYASEGLLLLTNDGEMANALTKAASHVPKTYLVKVSGQPSDAAIEQLRAGIELPDRKGSQSRTAPAGIQLVHKSENPWYEVTLIEGRNRQIRAMFELTGHHVEKLKRVRYGPFTLDVHPGKHRNLTPAEVELLREAVGRGAGASAEESVQPGFVLELDRDVLKRGDAGLSAEDLGSEVKAPVKASVKSFVKPFVKASGSRPSGAKAAGSRASGFKSAFRPLDQAGGGARSTHASAGKGPRLFGKPQFGQPRADAPRKWTQGAAAAGGRPKSFEKPAFAKRGFPPRSAGAGKFEPRKFEPRKFESRASDRKPGGFGARPERPIARMERRPEGIDSRSAMGARPERIGARPDRSGKSFGGPRREDSRGARPDVRPGARSGGARPAGGRFGDVRSAGPRVERPGGERKPFWQGADKRRPRKPKEDGFEAAREGAGERGERPARAGGFTRPKFGAGGAKSAPSFRSAKPSGGRGFGGGPRAGVKPGFKSGPKSGSRSGSRPGSRPGSKSFSGRSSRPSAGGSSRPGKGRR